MSNWSLESQSKFWTMVSQDLDVFKLLPFEMHFMVISSPDISQEDQKKYIKVLRMVIETENRRI